MSWQVIFHNVLDGCTAAEAAAAVSAFVFPDKVDMEEHGVKLCSTKLKGAPHMCLYHQLCCYTCNQEQLLDVLGDLALWGYSQLLSSTDNQFLSSLCLVESAFWLLA